MTATTTVVGQNELRCNLDGMAVFSIFLAEASAPPESPSLSIPANTVAGRVSGLFESQVSSPTRKVTGKGSGEWTVGGTYDPAARTIEVAIRSAGMNASGHETEVKPDAAPVPLPFSARFTWGPQFPRVDDPAAVLEVLKPPMPPAVPTDREADLWLVDSLPQTGLTEFRRVTVDLKDPKPQTASQTFQDEAGFGLRTTTWTMTLQPVFEIERVDRAADDGQHSFVTTDPLSFRIAIPGVAMEGSGWTGGAQWQVKGVGPFSGSANPSLVSNSPTFGFQPNPGQRPTEGSTTRNRPIQYSIGATFAGSVQYFLLNQDDKDLLRQEYIDHGEASVPARSDLVAHAVDNSFNSGNYNTILDGGMQAALDKITTEYRRSVKGSPRVVSGYRSPQRNRAMGDVHPGSPHVQGRAIDIVPEQPGSQAVISLYQACVRAGYHAYLESVPGRQLPLGSAEAKQVHVDW
ncbi:MAG: D-Ala-D-Ala carboxypeptidase family metallohydrolase [Nitrososphaerales archaeon]